MTKLNVFKVIDESKDWPENAESVGTAETGDIADAVRELGEAGNDYVVVSVDDPEERQRWAWPEGGEPTAKSDWTDELPGDDSA
jgi:uncharacterized protein (DUF736 family)